MGVVNSAVTLLRHCEKPPRDGRRIIRMVLGLGPKTVGELALTYTTRQDSGDFVPRDAAVAAAYHSALAEVRAARS